MHENEFGGSVNILRVCIVSPKCEVLQSKYLPHCKFNLSKSLAKNPMINKGFTLKAVIEI